ncbi:hypothetical protein ACSNOD_26305, partial [Streptomyces sp. URMC 123]
LWLGPGLGAAAMTGTGAGAGAEPPPGDGAGPRPEAGAEPSPGTSEAGAGPGVRAGVPVGAALATGGGDGSLLSVVARVNLTTGSGEIKYVNPVRTGRLSPLREDSPTVIRLLRRDGGLLDEYPVPVRLNSELLPSDDRVGIVAALIPAAPAATTVELLIAGRVVDTFHGGPPPAPVTMAYAPTAAAGAEGVPLRLDRPLQGNQTYAVQVSDDHGATWRTVGVGLREPVFVLDRTRIAPVGGDPATGGGPGDVDVRVITTNGFVSVTGRVQTFRV